MPKHSHILNAASNLLGICLLIITGLNVTDRSHTSFADEIAWLAAICFALSCLLSYLALRTNSEIPMYERWADRIFLVGLLTVVGAVAVLAFTRI